MPSLPVLTLPGVYTLIVELGNSTDPNVRWRNTWDISSPTSTPPASTDPIILGLIAWHRANLRTDCSIFLLTLRNWSQGPQPFAARPFIWQELFTPSTGAGTKTAAVPNGYGGSGPSGQSVPGAGCLRIERVDVGPGKSPSMFLRGLLDNNDAVAETGGKYVFSGVTVVTTPSFNSIVSSHIQAFCHPASGDELVNVHVGNLHHGPPFQHPITTVAMIGPTLNKQTRKNKK